MEKKVEDYTSYLAIVSSNTTFYPVLYGAGIETLQIYFPNFFASFFWYLTSLHLFRGTGSISIILPPWRSELWEPLL